MLRCSRCLAPSRSWVLANSSKVLSALRLMTTLILASRTRFAGVSICIGDSENKWDRLENRKLFLVTLRLNQFMTHLKPDFNLRRREIQVVGQRFPFRSWQILLQLEATFQLDDLRLRKQNPRFSFGFWLVWLSAWRRRRDNVMWIFCWWKNQINRMCVQKNILKETFWNVK